MTSLNTTGVDAPGGFPAEIYNRVHQIINYKASGHPNAIKFSGAWNALAYRNLEADECAVQFARHFAKYGSSPSSQERYHQERSIFDFYSAAVSCLDAVTFAIFAIASLKHGTTFPLSTEKDEKNATPDKLLAKLQANFPSDTITGAWEALCSNPQNKEIRDIRNVLTHRISPGRAHNVGGALDGQTQWQLDGGAMTKDFLVPHRNDLTDLLCGVLPAIEDFAIQRG